MPFRGGFTLVQLFVCLAILAILIAILLPAVQSARESARQVHCKNNIRQTMLAVQSHHAAHQSLPSFYNGTSLPYPLKEWDLFHMHSWRTMLLPELEQSALHESIQWKALATDNANATVAQTIVPTFICPSGDNPARKGWGLHHDATLDTQSGVAMPEDRYQVTRSDYDAMAGIEVLPNPFPTGANPHSVDYVRWGIWGWAVFDTKTTSGSRLLSYRRGKFRDVTDGLSHTIAIVERAGKPTQLRNGKPDITSDNPLAEYPGQVGWSASNTFAWSFHGDSIGVNASNVRGMFSFHPAGAHVGLADGSVRFLPETTTFDALVSLYGRSDGGLPE
ncbi:DUF1559 domain-containing protein [Bremerella sp. T1]|uniref:DUF1559 domain-containing protein n=1 Tax=Bremerella sp. TYQ1 TaxID=3119568 RepID=UPI001CCDBE35|nr:DUF1559 domain-containing protein [Bremerella volcania]UBM37753.1 DUF1559 domain-containing protein [Bremerella volcania]